VGIGPVKPAADELVVTIAQLAQDPRCGRPIRADVRVRSGSSDVVIATATDDSGSASVILKRGDTDGFREFIGANRCELWLVPFGGGVAEYLATRVVRL
jgi:hypothetical protein